MKRILSIVSALILMVGFFTFPVSARSSFYEKGFNYYVKDENAIITWTSITDDTLTVPGTLGGFMVTEIGDGAFSYKSFKNVILPDSITRIRSEAFNCCDSLASITIPKEVTTIEEYAFYNCVALKSVKFNKKITDIGEYAFKKATSLTEVSFPDSLKNIDYGAFEKCYKLKTVTFGNSLVSVSNRAFASNYKLSSIKFPKSLKEVGNYVFKSCSNIKSVKFGNPNTQLGIGVFKNCKSLKTIQLPKKIKIIPEYTFEDDQALTNAKIPSSVEIIKKNAFNNCKSLKKVVLPKKLYAIGDKAFSNTGLKKVIMNKDLEFIGNGAFIGTKLSTVSLPKKLVLIGNRIFADCQYLKSVRIPASVTGINVGAFNGCIRLSSINVDYRNKDYKSISGVLYNKTVTNLIQYPLSKKSKEFTVPYSVTKIRDNAFADNKYLKTLTTSAKEIGKSAFSNMISLNNVTLSYGVKNIGRRAFYQDNALSKVAIPSTVTYIGSSAFESTKIKSVDIPYGLKTLGSCAFSDCKKLTEFVGGKGLYYTVSDGVLYNAKQTTLISYPASISNETFVAPNSVNKIDVNAFTSANKLKKLVFGNELKYIKEDGIINLKNLKVIVFKTKKLKHSAIFGISNVPKLAVIVGVNNYIMRDLADSLNATLISL